LNIGSHEYSDTLPLLIHMVHHFLYALNATVVHETPEQWVWKFPMFPSVWYEATTKFFGCIYVQTRASTPRPTNQVTAFDQEGF